MFGKLFRKGGAASVFDFAVIGLGNPGREYENTRHNTGFIVIDALAEKYGAEIKKSRFHSLIGECRIGGNRVLLVKPQTYMNNSGVAVRETADFYKLTPERLLVVFDDISLDAGRVRIRRDGTDGGHNGIKSVISHIESDGFPRIKVGVGGKPHPDYDLKDWVLSAPDGEDLSKFRDAVSRAADAAAYIASTADIDGAMNRFNR